jgi:tetratricopeptide (TPR) repeat protein
MFELRPLSADAIPGALVKAERYRLLNEGGEAESICLDVLAVQPDHQGALTTLILALTDQFPGDGGAQLAARAQELVPRLSDEYARAYYSAIIKERRARAYVNAGHSTLASGWLLEALDGFDRAIALRPPGNDDAVLRWNACVRPFRRLPPHVEDSDRAEAHIMSE